MARLLFILVFLILVTDIKCMIFAEQQVDLCHRPECDCPDSGHPSWITVNCSVAATQKLDIFAGDIPDETTDIIVTGAEALMIGPGALSRLRDVRQLRVSGVRLVVLRSSAAVNLNVVNAYVEIDDCDVLRVEEAAFRNIRGPLSVTIRNCNYVSLEGIAFSWLLKMSISNVKTLMLKPGAFTLDPTAANVGAHGPGMSIELTNLTAPEIPAMTFGSSAAEITMTGVVVQAIRQGAFSANTYNEIRATDCSFHLIEGEAFQSNSLINNLRFKSCKIHQFASKAIHSAVTKLDFTKTRFDIVETGAINATVASVRISECEFHTFYTKGFELSSWNKFYMGKTKFDALPPNAIEAPPNGVVNELFFVENEIETVTTNSLAFIGQTFASKYAVHVVYKNNYFGVSCHCNISKWIANAMGSNSGEPFNTESYCTVNEFFAHCFNVPEQNMLFNRFFAKVCTEKSNIECEMYKTKFDVPTEIKNPRFPHKKEEDSLSDRDKKVIGIVIVTALGCVIIVMFVSLVRWMKRRGHCASIKNILMSSNSSCGTICGRLCVCGRNEGVDNAVSEMSVHEYSERRRLNEPRVPENMIMETVLPGGCLEEPTTPMDDKTTQTLPEELTKELLDNLKQKLDDPENYVEAREMIEHLYELIKVEDVSNGGSPGITTPEENIYDLPFQNTTPRIGKNKKQMISVGTRVPSLDKLLPLSPYNRQTALAHEYFEPKDFAVHLYAEITNCDKEKRLLLGNIPDIVEQVVPRGPYLRAVREKKSSPTGSPTSKSPKSPALSHTQTPALSPTRSLAMSPTKTPAISPARSVAMTPTKTPVMSPARSLAMSPSMTPALTPTMTSAMSPVRSLAMSPSMTPAMTPTMTSAMSPARSFPTSAATSPIKSPAMSPLSSPMNSHITSPAMSPSTIKSNKSTGSNSSAKMMNRPLPEKPVALDPGEGTSVALG